MSSRTDMECYNSGYQDGRRDTKDYAREDLECLIEDIAYWIANNLDDPIPMISRNDRIQNKIYKYTKEYKQCV